MNDHAPRPGPRPGPDTEPLGREALEAIVIADRDRTHGCRLIDARDLAGPPRDHLPGSAWIPWDDRLPAFLLPPRGRPVVVWGRHAENCARRLTASGWPASWADAEVPATWLRPGPPTAALWDIDSLLRRHLDRLPPPDAGPVLDIGCGSSREGIFLAQRGYRVVLVDRLPDALELAMARARHHGVDVVSRVETRATRLRRAEDLPPGPFAVALDFRFLRRGVLEALRPRLIAGGVLVLRSYGKPVEEAGMLGRGPRNPSERLGVEEAGALLGNDWRWIDPPRLVHEDDALWVTAVGESRG